MSKKAEIVFRTSQAVIDRFTNLMDDLNASKEETLSYLLDFHDKAKLDGGARSIGRFPKENALHASVAPEIRNQFKLIAAQYHVNYAQLLAALLDEHDRCASCCGCQTAEPVEETAAGTDDAGDLADRLDEALDTIRDIFQEALAASRRSASGEDEIRSLREQLAAAEEDAEKAKLDNQKIRQLLRQFADELR